MESTRAGWLAEPVENRLLTALGQIEITSADQARPPRPWIGVTCSRLGRSPELLQMVCRQCVHALRECARRGGTIWVARGSAIERWAGRASDLFSVGFATLSVESKYPATLCIRSQQSKGLCRDQALLQLTDQVDAVYVRRGGKIEQALSHRLAWDEAAKVRVGVTSSAKCAARDLIAKGAIGRWLSPAKAACRERRSRSQNADWVFDNWTKQQDWLVHCTRSRSGPWPDETNSQYMDAVLLNQPDAFCRQPIDSLSRILCSGSLLAGNATTDRSFPVVCFSEVPLAELLLRRTFRSHLGRWDYEPFGVAIRKSAAKSIGIQPVIYGDDKRRNQIPAHERFRFQASGKTFDWRREKEWRSLGNVELTSLAVEDVRVFVRDRHDLAKLPSPCPWPITVLQSDDLDEPALAGYNGT